MRIDLNGATPDPILSQQKNQPAPQASDAVDKHGEDQTSLSLSRDNIKSLVSQAMATAETRQDKVDALRQAVSSGQYKIEPEKVAEAILQESAKAESGS